MSPPNEINAPDGPAGTIATAVSEAPSPMTGAMRKTGPATGLYTAPLRNDTPSVSTCCQSVTPLRPLSTARVRLTTPGSSRAIKIKTTKLSMAIGLF